MQRIASHLRTISIKKRLLSLMLMLSVVVALLGVFILFGSINAAAGQLRQSGQQLLYSSAMQMEESRKEAISLTKYPVIANAYRSTEIYHYMTTSPKGFYSPVYAAIHAELGSELIFHPRVDFMGIADLQGFMIYCGKASTSYQLSQCDTSDSLFQDTLSEKGAPLLFTSAEAKTLFPSLTLPEDALYCSRAVMQLGPLSCAGVIICRVPLSSISSSFAANRLFDTQELTILSSDGETLYGKPLDIPAHLLSSIPVGQLFTKTSWVARSFYQFYRISGDNIACLRTPFNSMYPLLRIALALALLLPLIIVSVLFTAYLIISSIRQPIDKLMTVCTRVSHEDFSAVEDEGACDEMHLLIGSFNHMSEEIRRLIEEVYKRNLMQAKTEMLLVRSQINPHFVYNTLETIRAEAYIHGEYAIADMTTLLGKTLRYGISRQGDCVTVAAELSHLQDYIALQQMRLGKKMNVLISIPEDLQSCYMIRLALQPLVENAIHHGLPEGEDSGEIRILGYQEGHDLFFSVSDNGSGIPAEELEHLQNYIVGGNNDYTSIGLRNTHCRLELFFGKPYGLSIRSVPDLGTSVTLRLPLLRKPFDFGKEESHDSSADC